MNTYIDAEKNITNGVFLYNQGEYADAIMNFVSAMEFYENANDEKKLAFLWNCKGMALESLGTNYPSHCLELALDHFNAEALECFENAIAHFNKVADADPTDIADAYRNQGYTYTKVEDYDKALECFENAIAHFNKVADADPTDIADVYRNHGYAIAKRKYCAESFDDSYYLRAISSLEKATNQCSKFALAWNTKGYIHTMHGKYEEARECFIKAINIDPNFAKAWRNYGYANYCMKKNKVLEEDLTIPNEIDKNIKEKEKWDNVIESLSKATELDPNDPYTWHYRAHVYFRMKEYECAISDFEKAIQIRSSFYDAWYSKGMVLDSMEQYKEARECFEESIKLCKEEIEKMENQKIGECKKLEEYKKLAYMYNSKGISLITLTDSLPEHRKVEAGQLKKAAIESFHEAVKIYEEIQKNSMVKIETDLGLGLALCNKGYSIGDSVVDDDTKSSLEHEKQYKHAIECLKRAISCFEKIQKNNEPEHLVNKDLINMSIAEAWRIQGFLHAKLAELFSDKGTKREEHVEAFDCFEKSTKESSFALAWNSRGYHLIGFLDDLENCEAIDRKEAIDKAKGYFENAISYANQYTKYQAYFHYNKGYAFYISGSDKWCKNPNEAKEDFKFAASCFEEALRFDGKYADAWLNRAISLYYSGELDESNKFDIIKFLDNSIESYKETEYNNNFAYAWYYKGIMLALLERYEGAIECFDEATSLNHSLGEAWYRKGVCFYFTQKYKHAIKCFDEAEGYYKDRENKFIEYIELLLIRGQSKYNAGNLEGAMNDLHKIPDENDIKDNENDIKEVLSRKYLNLGLIHYKLEELEDAKKMYDEAKKYDSNLAEIYYNLAKLHSIKNENKEAKQSLEKCNIILVNSPKSNEELREKAREAGNKHKESRQTDWYQWWVGHGKGKKIAGIVLIAALLSFIISPIIIMDRAIMHLINSNSTGFTTFITSGVTTQTIAAFTLAIGVLLAILLLPSLQKFKVATIELETIPANVRDQEIMTSPPLEIKPPVSTQMPYKITAQYFRMPLRYQTRMQQVYTPIEPARTPSKYRRILFAPIS